MEYRFHGKQPLYINGCTGGDMNWCEKSSILSYSRMNINSLVIIERWKLTNIPSCALASILARSLLCVCYMHLQYTIKIVLDLVRYANCLQDVCCNRYCCMMIDEGSTFTYNRSLFTAVLIESHFAL